ncbi:MAG: hypothetical protein ABI900_08950, partial [Betaproteobacteria bacterium]
MLAATTARFRAAARRGGAGQSHRTRRSGDTMAVLPPSAQAGIRRGLAGPGFPIAVDLARARLLARPVGAAVAVDFVFLVRFL